jgi:hypothetical protein
MIIITEYKLNTNHKLDETVIVLLNNELMAAKITGFQYRINNDKEELYYIGSNYGVEITFKEDDVMEIGRAHV